MSCLTVSSELHKTNGWIASIFDLVTLLLFLFICSQQAIASPSSKVDILLASVQSVIGSTATTIATSDCLLLLCLLVS